MSSFLQWLIKLLQKLLYLLERPAGLRINVVSVRSNDGFHFGFGHFKRKGGVMSFQLQDAQNVGFSIQEVDAAGNPTNVPFDSPAVWSLSDDTLGTLAVTPDGNSANLKATGKLGSLQVNVSASVAGKTLTGALQVDIVPGPAASINIQPGAPVSN